VFTLVEKTHLTTVLEGLQLRYWNRSRFNRSKKVLKLPLRL